MALRHATLRGEPWRVPGRTIPEYPTRPLYPRSRRMLAFDPPSWVPAPLLRAGPYQLALWQWLALPATAAAAWIASRLLGGATHAVLTRFAARTETSFDDEMVEGLSGPIVLAWFFAALHALLVLIELPPRPELFTIRAINGGLFLAFFWALFRFVDVGKQAVHRSRWASANPSSRQLLALGSRVAKAIVAAMTIIAVVSALGFPVASLIAGLGIGGLALALAAQKTVENLFGAFAIGFDQPIREGDFVQIDGVKGWVESIGLRSTRVRTSERTMVCFPNGRLAETRTENYAARDRFRFYTVLGLTYGTSAAQMRQILAGVDGELRGQSKFYPGGSLRWACRATRRMRPLTLDIACLPASRMKSRPLSNMAAAAPATRLPGGWSGARGCGRVGAIFFALAIIRPSVTSSSRVNNRRQ
ncbi:MAG: mechanosensitive ion channel family protein [Deltaproteobacteria bacterium]|nr:MAG: mechanosensitive ion channel family protein [Deltaproteobacteria bacterium]